MMMMTINTANFTEPVHGEDDDEEEEYDVYDRISMMMIIKTIIYVKLLLCVIAIMDLQMTGG